jgi:hypothetical protein
LFISMRSGASVSQLLAESCGAAGGANDAGIVEAGGHLLDSRCFGQSDARR